MLACVGSGDIREPSRRRAKRDWPPPGSFRPAPRDWREAIVLPMSDGVHPLVNNFGAAADAYERGRPGYPAEAVDAVVTFLHLAPGRAVLDLGAGTGKLTRLLVPTGARVIAVEP